MIDDVLAALACPHCESGLSRVGGVLGCANGHRFDIARQGYVSLLGPRSRTDTGDTAEMVLARADFLAAGHYAPIAAAVVEVLPPDLAGLVVEIGAGVGYYLAAVLDTLPAAAGLALDSSVRAARRAAVAHSRIGAIVADAWSRLPIRPGAANAVLSIFAPRDPIEIHRILAPGGVLVTVTPTANHLGELIGRLGMLSVAPSKEARLATTLGGHFTISSSSTRRMALRLTATDLSNVVLMGPAAHHVDRTELAATIAGLAVPIDAFGEVTVAAWTSVRLTPSAKSR